MDDQHQRTSGLQQQTVASQNANTSGTSQADSKRWFAEKRLLIDQLTEAKKKLLDVETNLYAEKSKSRRQTVKVLRVKRKNKKLRQEMSGLYKKIFDALSDVSSDSDE